jgi:hypothetical protein
MQPIWVPNVDPICVLSGLLRVAEEKVRQQPETACVGPVGEWPRGRQFARSLFVSYFYLRP